MPSEMSVAPHHTLLSLFILFKLLYTASTVAYMPIYILSGKLRTQLEWADRLLSKMLDGMDVLMGDTPYHFTNLLPSFYTCCIITYLPCILAPFFIIYETIVCVS